MSSRAPNGIPHGRSQWYTGLDPDHGPGPLISFFIPARHGLSHETGKTPRVLCISGHP